MQLSAPSPLPSPLLLLVLVTTTHVTCGGRGVNSCEYRGGVAHCDARNLTSVPTGLSQNTTRVLLQLNRLARLDFGQLGLLTRVRAINCSHAAVRSVSGTGAALPQLRELDLSGNQLNAVSANTFRSFGVLRRLDLSGNRIVSVADAGLVLPRLTSLDLSTNLLTAVTRFAFVDLTELRELDLSHNLLLRIAADAFTGSRNFSRLDLSHNRLSRLDATALRGLHVQTLDLSDNLFRRVPTAALKALKFARLLALDGWPVEQLGTRALHKITVREVRLSGAPRLRHVARHAVDDMPLLERLTIARSPQLDFIQPEMSRRTPVLRYVDLSHNGLLTLSPRTLPTSALRLDLSANPLRCDCALRWLAAPPQRLVRLSVAVDARCAPSRLRLMPGRCRPHVLPLFAANRTVALGDSVTFQCAATAAPVADLAWTLPAGVSLGAGGCRGRACVEDDRLTLQYVHSEDVGEYTCGATNPLGAASRSVLVHVQEPRVVLIPVSVTSTFVTVSWNITGGSIVTFLLIQEPPTADGDRSSDGNAVTFSVHNVGLQTQSFTFNHLQPGREYTFWLALQRGDYVIRLTSLKVTTRGPGFLSMRGRRKNYATVVAMAIPAGAIFAACLGMCARKLHHWRRHRRNMTLNQLARSGVMPSTSNTSDMTFLNHSAALFAGEEADTGAVIESTCSVIGKVQ